jgi:hypothetical protein
MRSARLPGVGIRPSCCEASPRLKTIRRRLMSPSRYSWKSAPAGRCEPRGIERTGHRPGSAPPERRLVLSKTVGTFDDLEAHVGKRSPGVLEEAANVVVTASSPAMRSRRRPRRASCKPAARRRHANSTRPGRPRRIPRGAAQPSPQGLRRSSIHASRLLCWLLGRPYAAGHRAVNAPARAPQRNSALVQRRPPHRRARQRRGSLDADLSEAERILAQAAGSGVDLPTVTAELEREGVASFCDSYRELLDCIQTKHAEVAASPTGRGGSACSPRVCRALLRRGAGAADRGGAWPRVDRVLAVALSGGASQRRASRRPLCVLGGV